MDTPAKTTADLMKEFREAPGINVTTLTLGTRVIVETTTSVFEFVVVDSEHIRFSGSECRFHVPLLGRFVQSVYDTEGKMFFPGWIKQNLRMDVEFKNATFRSTPVLNACVIGKGYKYDVF